MNLINKDKQMNINELKTQIYNALRKYEKTHKHIKNECACEKVFNIEDDIQHLFHIPQAIEELNA